MNSLDETAGPQSNQEVSIITGDVRDVNKPVLVAAGLYFVRDTKTIQSPKERGGREYTI